MHKPGRLLTIACNAKAPLSQTLKICPKQRSLRSTCYYELVKSRKVKSTKQTATLKGRQGQNPRNGKHKHLLPPKPQIPPPPPKGKIPQRTQSIMSVVRHDIGERNCHHVLSRVAKEEKNSSSGAVVVSEAIGNFGYISTLPSGLVIVLNNCHYAPSITRGVISVSRLYEDGFINRFVNNTIQVSRNNMVYFSAIPRDGIFEIDLSNSYTNENSIYTVSNKRAKLDLDSALLWHCRLGHISKKRIEKLQHDGLLNSTDLRA
ncbi:zinc finger, CCHC-type containing protein [Tanacetum coccineum]